MFRRASAITVPGIVLSQPEIATSASNWWAEATSSIESAIISRETSEARMPGGAHRDAVGDRDRVELHRRAAGRADALLDLRGEHAVVEVARHRLDPRVRDADDRLGEVLGGVADAMQVGARGGALGPLGEGRLRCLTSKVARRAHAARTLSAEPPRAVPQRSRSQRARRAGRAAPCRVDLAAGRCMLASPISRRSSAVSAIHLASTSSESGRRALP